MWTNLFSFLLSATSGNDLATGSLEFCFLTGFDSLNRQWGQELQFDPLAPTPSNPLSPFLSPTYVQ